MYDRLLKIALYAATIKILLTPLSGGVSTIFGYIMLLCFFLNPIVNSVQEKRVSLTALAVIFCVVLSAITSFAFFQTEELISKIISVVSFASFYWTLSSEHGKNSAICLKDMFICGYILTAVFLIYTFLNVPFKYTVINEYGSIVFTMGLGNPNEGSFYVMVAIMILMLRFVYIESALRKVFIVGLIGTLVYILLKLQSRTVVFCVLIFLVYGLFFSRRKAGRAVQLAFMLVPFAMIFIQIFEISTISDITILGKQINTGRNAIYGTFFNELRETPYFIILGNLCKYHFSNLHNGLLAIFASLGLVGVVLYIKIWFDQFKAAGADDGDRVRNIALFSMLIFVLHSSAEAMSAVGSLPYGIFMVIIAKIAKGDIEFCYEKEQKTDPVRFENRLPQKIGGKV